MDDKSVEVVITYPKTKRVTKLGRQLKISSKTKVEVQEAGFKLNYHTPTAIFDFGIGHDHTGTVIMSEEAWEEFTKGFGTTTTTLKEYKKNLK